MSDKDEKFKKTIKEDVKKLASTLFDTLKKEAINDATDFIKYYNEKIERWNGLLQEGKLKADEYENLMGSLRDYGELIRLKNQGIAQVKMDEFLNGVINIIMTAAISIMIP